MKEPTFLCNVFLFFNLIRRAGLLNEKEYVTNVLVKKHITVNKEKAISLSIHISTLLEKSGPLELCIVLGTNNSCPKCAIMTGQLHVTFPLNGYGESLGIFNCMHKILVNI